MVSPFLRRRKGVCFGRFMDSIFECPLQGRVNPVGDAVPITRETGQWAGEGEDGM